MVGVVVALSIGVIGTSVIHLSKGVMKLGVQQMHAGAGKRMYLAGMVLNFSNPLWVVVANRFAPTVYYTSMYGLGLVALLVFSRLFLKEELGRTQVIGAGVVVLGTLLLGYSRIRTPSLPFFLADRQFVLVIAGAWLLGAPLLAAVSRNRSLSQQEAVFGLLGGGFASLEAVLKGISQSVDGAASFLPGAGADWVIFAVSFLGAAGAFGMIQWSYLRRCRVALMTSSYDVAYVALPLLIAFVALPDSALSTLDIAGLVVLAAGSLLAQGAID